MCQKLDCLYLVGEKDGEHICDMLYAVLRWVGIASTCEVFENLCFHNFRTSIHESHIV